MEVYFRVQASEERKSTADVKALFQQCVDILSHGLN